MCIKRFYIKDLQAEYEQKVRVVDTNLELVQKTLKRKTRQLEDLQWQIDDILASSKSKKNKHKTDWEEIEAECIEMESGADYLQKERTEMAEEKRDLDGDIIKLDKEIDKTEITIEEYKKDIDKVQHKISQRTEGSNEINQILKIYGKQLSKGNLVEILNIKFNEFL